MMKKCLLLLLNVYAISVLAQNEVGLFFAASGSVGCGADLTIRKNIDFADSNGELIGTVNSNSVYLGLNAGARAKLGVSWRKMQIGFRFGYDRFFMRKHKLTITPNLMGFSQKWSNSKIDINTFSYAVFVGYAFSVKPMLSITPQLALGSYTGFIKNYNTGLSVEPWPFSNYMRNKFMMTASCVFDIQFSKFSVFIAPEYGFYHYRNHILGNMPSQPTTLMTAGNLEIGLNIKLVTFNKATASI